MSGTPVNPFARWSEIASASGGAAAYQEHFDELEASGVDVHGEARLVASLVPVPARVLDAGCGTGRVARALTRLGYVCQGVDADLAMVQVARERDPATHYVHADLADLYLRTQAFDVVLLAGNVVPLLAPGTLDGVVDRVAVHTKAGGSVVAGFGLDAAHLPEGCPVTSTDAYDDACTAAGLSLLDRWATWEREPWTPGAGYAVSLHQRPA
ncbi:MAG TPA: class I SAM-dependent methyltransferase [Dermatophilaceae bacterium]|nr:class I SAM-dependent methyltransferase [Dermatophilaceae bacterium]